MKEIGGKREEEIKKLEQLGPKSRKKVIVTFFGG